MIKKLLLTIALGIFITMPMKSYAQFTIPAGGTGLSAYTAGDIPYAASTNPIRFTKLNIGGNGLCLTSNGSIPVWGNCGGGAGSSGGTWSTTTSQVGGQFINYPNNSTDVVNIGSTATTTGKFYFDPNTSRSLIPYASSTMITALSASTSQAIFNGGPWVDARTCGTKADGSTDDSSAINTCISNLATAGGGTIYISATANRSTLTKYEICANPINMQSLVRVIVQWGVAIEACNGFATSTINFLTGVHDAIWDGGQLQEAGQPQKLWNSINFESDDVSGGVFFNIVRNVRIIKPKNAIRLFTNNNNNGWLNSNEFDDVTIYQATNMVDYEDTGVLGAYGISNTTFKNLQMQADVGTETCIENVKHRRNLFINATCYDTNATSTDLSIAQGTANTTIIGGKTTVHNFSDLGTSTIIVGDPNYPNYNGGLNGLSAPAFYTSPTGHNMIGTTSTAWDNGSLNIANGSIDLSVVGQSVTNSQINFMRTGSADNQKDYMRGLTNPISNTVNSGSLGVSTRESIINHIDSDNTSCSTFWSVGHNSAVTNIQATGEMFRVMEDCFMGQMVGIGTTSPFATLSVQGVSTMTATTSLVSIASTTGATLFNVLSNGNVGIGTTTPYAALSVVGSTGVVANIYTATGTSASTFPYASTTALSATTICWTSTCTTAPTISGVALGGTLNALTATNGTLTFSGSYDGTNARTVGLNLNNANAWTASTTFQLQTNMQQASSTILTATNGLYGTYLGTVAGAFLATDPNGKIIATTSPAGTGTVTTLTAGTNITFSSGATCTSTCTINSSGGGGSGTPDWNKQTTFNTLSLTPTTTIAVWLKDKLFASSTAQIDGDVNIASSTLISLASVASTSISHLETGGLSFDQDAGIVNAFDLPVVNATNNTVESYSFNVNASTTPTMTIYAESDGSSGAKNQRVGIGTTTPWRALDVNGTVGMKGLTTSSSAQSAYICLSATNEVISDSTTCLVSALKFKKNIVNLDVGLNELMKLRPVSYELKDTMGDINNKGRQIGFIADEAKKVDPRLVTLDSNGDIHGFRYEQFTAVITKSIQELNAKVQSAKRSAEENWQWIVMGLLAIGFVYQQVQIKKLKK